MLLFGRLFLTFPILRFSSFRKSSASWSRLRIGFYRIPWIRKWLIAFRLRRLFPLPAMKRHTLLVAKSGFGKSQLLKWLIFRLKKRLLRWPFQNPYETKKTVILIDPHGETAREGSIAFQRKFGLQNNYIAPSNHMSSCPCVNPFDIQKMKFDDASREVLAQFMTRTFSSMLGKNHRDLSLNMKSLLYPMFSVLLALSQQPGREPMTFFDLERFFDSRRNHDLIEYGAHHHRNYGQNLFFQHHFFEPQLTTTKFALKTKLAGLLNSPIFVKLMAQPRSSWNLYRLIGSGRVALINASKALLGSEISEVYGRTLIALIQSYILMKARKTSIWPTRRATFLLIDEASTLAGEDVKSMLAELRKFHLHLVLVHQYLNRSDLNQGLADAVLGNTAIKITGNVGYSSRRIMAQESACPTEALDHMRVGEFLVHVDGRRAKRVLFPDFPDVKPRKPWSKKKAPLRKGLQNKPRFSFFHP